jgi:hypothetical protein
MTSWMRRAAPGCGAAPLPAAGRTGMAVAVVGGGAALAEAAAKVVCDALLSGVDGVAAHQLAALKKRNAPRAGSHIGVWGSGRGWS